MAKSDIKISKLRNLPTTPTITTLGEIDVTSSSSYPDGYAIISKDAPNHRLYILNRSSTDTPDNDQFVASNVSGVVWERIMGTSIAANDLRGTFDITLNPAEYPKGDNTTAVNATQVGDGSGAGPSIMAGDYWYVINNGTGTKTVGPTPKQILTNNAILLALVDNATNDDDEWIILEQAAGSDLAPNIASLRTLGTGAQQAAAGNDTRLSDARVPLTHAATHKHGGADEIATATPAANEIPKANGTGKLDAWITGASESAVGLIEIATQAESDTGTDDSRAITALKLANNSRMPSQAENDALQGTSGTPSNTNRYVTDEDTRLTNARTPVGTALTSTQIWVGSAGNVAAAVSVTGDISISNTGVVSIPSTFISSKTTVTPASGDFILIGDVSDSNNLKKILVSSLPAGSSVLNNGQIFVGNASNVATGVSMSGDATISNTGVVTISGNAVTNSKLRLSTGLSVMGRSAATAGEVEDIIATAEGHVLQVKAGILVFDTVSATLVSPLTTKGDIWTYSTVNARLAVGTNGQILSADSAETTGLKWIPVPVSLPDQTGHSGKYLTTDGTNASWATVSSGATNLSVTPSPTTVVIESDTGTDATIVAVDGTNAGVMLPADKTKLDGIEAGATAIDFTFNALTISSNAVSYNAASAKLKNYFIDNAAAGFSVTITNPADLTRIAVKKTIAGNVALTFAASGYTLKMVDKAWSNAGTHEYTMVGDLDSEFLFSLEKRGTILYLTPNDNY